MLLREMFVASLLMLACTTAFGQQSDDAFAVHKDSAVAYLENREYLNALNSFKRSFQKGNTDLYDYYNAACCAARVQQLDEAFHFLGKSIDNGYLDKPWAMRDGDLAPLRSDQRWPAVLAKFDEKKGYIEGLLAPIKGREPSSLVPFQENRLWGYLDKRSLAVIVPADFKWISFMNGCARARYRDECEMRISTTGEIEGIFYPAHGQRDFGVAMDDPDSRGPFPVSSKDGFKGFTMNDKKEITHFSDIYNRVHPNVFNISGPVVINGKYYAVVHKEGASGIIDEQGNPLRGFNFVHRDLVWNRRAEEGIWFYFTDSAGTTGFISDRGKKRLAGELLDYPFSGNDAFDFNIQRKDQRSGVLDLRKMEWLVKPQGLRITSIAATTKAGCNQYPNDRAVVIDLYFFIRDKAGDYYTDRKLKPYRPVH